ncbi:MAG: DUF2752 domain-containing protein [Oscillospiraceae bacterium]|jgi:hypothetical protein|nr:DUF2752 domain-containing protein [Oscillospiraceae bacterium]
MHKTVEKHKDTFKKTTTQSSMPVLRLFVGIFAPMLIAAGLLLLRFAGNNALHPFLHCPFYEVTHLQCPGCGSGRALYALLHLDFVAAFLLNPLFVVALPILAYCFFAAYANFVFKLKLPLPKIRRKTTVILIVAVIIIFFVLRNLF